ncbi:hypothetical protein R5H32_15915 [Defluviimonas sp. D31]|nr:hypothetical protein [Defluviimonas sp. D31]
MFLFQSFAEAAALDRAFATLPRRAATRNPTQAEIAAAERRAAALPNKSRQVRRQMARLYAKGRGLSGLSGLGAAPKGGRK